MTEWKDWKPGDKLVCVNHGRNRMGDPGVPEIGATYTLVSMMVLEPGDAVRVRGKIKVFHVRTCLVFLAEFGEFSAYCATMFKRLEEKPEHRGMAILREIGAGTREPEQPSVREAVETMRAARGLAWKRAKAWLGQQVKVQET